MLILRENTMCEEEIRIIVVGFHEFLGIATYHGLDMHIFTMTYSALDFALNRKTAI